MSKAPQPIVVTLKEGRHATQPWTFTINRPGPQAKETKSERYVSLFSAKRGAKRMLKGDTRPVTFIVIRRKKAKA